MLRRKLVRQRHRVSQCLDLDQPAVPVEHLLEEFPTRQLLLLPPDFLLNPPEQLS